VNGSSALSFSVLDATDRSSGLRLRPNAIHDVAPKITQGPDAIPERVDTSIHGIGRLLHHLSGDTLDARHWRLPAAAATGRTLRRRPLRAGALGCRTPGRGPAFFRGRTSRRSFARRRALPAFASRTTLLGRPSGLPSRRRLLLGRHWNHSSSEKDSADRSKIQAHRRACVAVCRFVPYNESVVRPSRWSHLWQPS
jgi:hypothetical protein